MQLTLCKIIQLKRNYLFYCLLLLVLSSCSKPKGFEYKGLNHVTIKNVGFEYIDVSLNLVCYNPNNFRSEYKFVYK